MEKNLKNKNENKKGARLVSTRGITLIALVFTIVILIILAGVAISLSLGENGIFSKALQAKQQYVNEQAKEETEIAKITNEIDTFTRGGNNINSGFFIDTSRKIATIANSYSWETQSYQYTATEDCAIVGQIGAKNRGAVTILINSVSVGLVNNFNSSDVYSVINYYLKAGDKIEFNYSAGETAMFIDAYALK